MKNMTTWTKKMCSHRNKNWGNKAKISNFKLQNLNLKAISKNSSTKGSFKFESFLEV